MNIISRRVSRKTKSKTPPVSLDGDSHSNDSSSVSDQPNVSSKGRSNVNKSQSPSISNSLNAKNIKRKKRDSGSSDEERWLSAIESGKLEDVDEELKKIKPKDPSLMTARQRAIYDRGVDRSPLDSTPALMSLPTGYKEKIMTAEAIQKAAIKSQKRKQLADEKREKDKKKTMDRLLKKQEVKIVKAVKKITKCISPMIVYRETAQSTTLTFPNNMSFPLESKVYQNPPSVRYCSMNCGNYRKYSCSKTGVSLCSLECYKKNAENHSS